MVLVVVSLPMVQLGLLEDGEQIILLLIQMMEKPGLV
jgi:hypothetical protein